MQVWGSLVAIALVATGCGRLSFDAVDRDAPPGDIDAADDAGDDAPIDAFVPAPPFALVATAGTPSQGLTHQRRGFFALGRYWVFYVDGTTLMVRSASDPSAWSAPAVVATGMNLGPQTGGFSVASNGTTVHLAFNRGDAQPLVYLRGALVASGALLLTPEAIAAVGVVDSEFNLPAVTVNSAGQPWITYNLFRPSNTSYFGGQVSTSNTLDGTWSTAPGFPFVVDATLGVWRTAPVRLASGDLAIVWAGFGGIHSRVWSNASWGAIQTVHQEGVCTACVQRLSAVEVGTSLHAGFLLPTAMVAHAVRSAGTWGAIETLGPGDIEPSLVADPTTDSVLAVWVRNDVIVYRRRLSGTWGPEQVCIDETDEGIAGSVNAFPEVGGGRLMVVYRTLAELRVVQCL